MRRETADLAIAVDDIDSGWEATPASVSIPQHAPLSSLPPVTSVPRPRSSTRELAHARSVSSQTRAARAASAEPSSEVADGPTLEIQEVAFEGEDTVSWIGEALGSYPSIEVCEVENDLGDLACEIDDRHTAERAPSPFGQAKE